MRVVVVCPGRGSYTRAQLGSLAEARGRPAAEPIVTALDDYRRSLGRIPISEVDHAPAFSPALHVAGEHASLLTFACTAVDLAALSPAIDVVGVTGNSLGFYTALHACGALALAEAARLIETLGSYQADHVVGAQVVYPVVDDRWLPSPPLAAAVDEALRLPGVHVSIRLGGTIVLGLEDRQVGDVTSILPPLERGGVRYPLRLALHSAFHTPLMAATSTRARSELADLAMRSPRITLIGGDGAVHRPWADPGALWEYTLDAQITEPFDFSRAVATAVGELAPEAIVLPGPNDNLGGAIAQILIAQRWRGLRDRQDFVEAQASERPIVLAMARPDQRARLV